MKKKKENRGGRRPGSGRKNPGYKTKTIAARIPVQLEEPIKELIKAAIENWKQNQISQY